MHKPSHTLDGMDRKKAIRNTEEKTPKHFKLAKCPHIRNLQTDMRIISTKDAVFSKIEDALSERQEDIQLEFLAGIDCDEQDFENQRDLGAEDPIASIELVAQWLPETGEGLLDWFFVRLSAIDADPPQIELGGPLLAFNTEDKTPDLDQLIEKTVETLNTAVNWAEFELEEEV